MRVLFDRVGEEKDAHGNEGAADDRQQCCEHLADGEDRRVVGDRAREAGKSLNDGTQCAERACSGAM